MLDPAFLDQIQSTLSYNPETGVITWVGLTGNKKFRNGTQAGMLLQRRGKPNRYRLKLNNQWLSGSRVAYILMLGQDVPPGFMLDHRDRDATNNRWGNLRLATSSQNNANRVQKRRAPVAVGLPPGVGVCANGYYRVLITKDNRVVFEAKRRDLAAAKELAVAQSLKFHGEFSPYYQLS